MTYNVFSGTLNPAQSINQSSDFNAVHEFHVPTDGKFNAAR